MKMRLPSLPALGALFALALAPLAGKAQPLTAEPLTPAMKTEVIDGLLKNLQSDYVFPDKATEAAGVIQTHVQAHDYDNVNSGEEFARLLTQHLRSVCKDAHLHVAFSPSALPVRKRNDNPSPEEIQQQRLFEKRMNGGVEKVERLKGNVGYLEVRGFLDPKAAAQPIHAAMDFLANTDALILDLRRNGGGAPETVRLLCSYLFDAEPVHLNDLYMREGNRTVEFWTLRSLPGHRYLNREVYVLTSKRTGSGAEECSYDLQSLKRATIVGGVTWGGANPGHDYRLSDHFSAFIPGGRAINPYTHANWEGTGVTPDVVVAPEQALQTAHLQALRHLQEKATTAEEKEFRAQSLEVVEAEYKSDKGQQALPQK